MFSPTWNPWDWTLHDHVEGERAVALSGRDRGSPRGGAAGGTEPRLALGF